MSEFELQCTLAEYIRLQYPDALFHSSLDGLRLPVGLAVKVERLGNGRGWPDLFLAEPRGVWLGLFLELKVDRSEIYTKAGKLRQDRHIREQQAALVALRERGYQARFACGFDEAKEIIDDYLCGARVIDDDSARRR